MLSTDPIREQVNSNRDRAAISLYVNRAIRARSQHNQGSKDHGKTVMISSNFSLQEDIQALAELLDNVHAAKQVGLYLQRIQTAPSKDQLTKWLEQVTGYTQALDDLGLLNSEQSILLRELVTRALMRNALK